AAPYQKIKPHPFLIANQMVPGSYVSLQAALAFYGLIPEYVPVTTSVTAHRPARWNAPLGDFVFHHLQPHLMHGYQRLEVAVGQTAYVARPEKAVLDLTYFQPVTGALDYVQELRLQNLEVLDQQLLRQLADEAGKPKLRRVAAAVSQLA